MKRQIKMTFGRILCLALILSTTLWNARADDTDETDEPTSTNLQGLALNIYCTNVVSKLGDEIPIEFVISNAGTKDFVYDDRDSDRSGRMTEYAILLESADGEVIPDPRAHYAVGMAGGLFTTKALRPRKFFTKTIPLNLWAIIPTPGKYTVTGVYLGNDSYPGETLGGVKSPPLTIVVLPRTESQVDAYIADLTNQVTQANATKTGADPLLMKLAFTCNPKIVPCLLDQMYRSEYNFWEAEALVVYLPHSEAIRKQVIETALKRGLADGMDYVLAQYHCADNEWRLAIERSLAEDNPRSWAAGALAAQEEPDDAFTPRLIALALEGTSEAYRDPAIYALSFNRTDASVNALKSLLSNTNEDIRFMAKEAIREAYARGGHSKGRPFRPEDFEKKFQKPANISGQIETQSNGN
ncbi:MAG TPA: hypothetical protein VGY98_10085 [Verrucomicrobiae bacterium]|nr:hypothetical protein [Verrucomicrobiae bacterium]